MKRLFVAMCVTALLAWPAMAAEPAALNVPNPSAPQWRAGGDLRLRWVADNNMPTFDHGESGGEDYFRIRTRLWGQVTTERIEAFLRVTNEFRYYCTPHDRKGRQRFPDVTLIDNLYVTFKDVGDLVDIKIGRQDLRFGNGRMISEGTVIDGSRTCYFDAARLTFKFDDKRTLDAFALYIAREDWMPTLGRRHDPRSADTKSYHEDITAYNQNEYGAGLYYQDRSSAAFGWDLYYIFKGEEGSHSTVLENGPFHSHTFGTRLLPRFTETLSGETELAVQIGDDNLLAAQAYTGLTYSPGWHLKPAFTVAALYLSGDRDATRGKHAWHSLFNRDTALGDIVGAMYNVYDHTNLFYPHFAINLTPATGHTLSFTTGPLFAPVSESNPAGGTYSKYRGYYVQAWYVIDVGQYIARGTPFEDMKFRIFSEAMTKGDYYRDGEDNLSYYLELQLLCAF